MTLGTRPPMQPDSTIPRFEDDPDQLEWYELVRQGIDAREKGDSSNWELGDLARLRVQTKYGKQSLERYASDISVEYNSLRVYRAVSQAFEIDTRVSISWAHHRAVMAHPDRLAWLARAKEEGLSVDQLRMMSAPPPPITPPLPDGIYDLIYADPPWRYEFVEAENRAIENQYPTMELEDICDLDIEALIPDDALLLLWATSPKLEEAMQVMKAWGFEYRSCFVWVKNVIGMGYWARQRHELLLVGRRGEFSPPPPELRPDSVIEAPRQEHSEKPEQFFNLIDVMFPDARKLELFSRRNRDGWTVWGNEVS